MFCYIYENYGIGAVIDVLHTVDKSSSSGRAAAVSDVLGVDILEEVPKWYEENADRFFSNNAPEAIALESGYHSFMLDGDGTFYLHARTDGPVLIDFRNGHHIYETTAKDPRWGGSIYVNRIGGDGSVRFSIYNINDELVESAYGNLKVSTTDKPYDFAYIIVEGAAEFRITLI